MTSGRMKAIISHAVTDETLQLLFVERMVDGEVLCSFILYITQIKSWFQLMRIHVHVFLVMVTPANVHEMMVHNVQALLPK